MEKYYTECFGMVLNPFPKRSEFVQDRFCGVRKRKSTKMIWKVLGGILLVKYGISLSQFLCLMMRLYVLPRFGMKLDLKKYGKWAVVTGATDGIGKAIAVQLAKRGLSVVLIGRSEDKLKQVAEELESHTEVKTIKYDFNNTDEYDEIEKELKDLEIGVLVNNVGISYDHPDFYLNYSSEFFDSMININITSVLKMSRMVLDKMVKRGKGGVLLHISSASGLLPVPFLSVYASSKSFVDFFGQSLAVEYASNGIISQVATPFFVATKLSKLRPNGTSIPSADTYAKQVLNAIGVSPSITGHWAHELQKYIQFMLPEFIVRQKTYKLMDGFRRRWLRKQQEKEKESKDD